MNNDLISREALKSALKSNCTPEICHDYGTNWCEVCCPHNDFEDLIDNAPTVECERNIMTEEAYFRLQASKERPQGEWITRHKQNSFGQDMVCFECDKCHKYTLPLINTMITEPLLVCPNCGADMRKGGAK